MIIAAPLPHSAGLLNRMPSVCKLFLTLASCPPTDSNCNCNSNSALNWLKPSVAAGYIIIWFPPASCERTHLYRIQPRPQVKGIFRYLRPNAPVSWLTARLRVNMLHMVLRISGFWKKSQLKVDIGPWRRAVEFSAIGVESWVFYRCGGSLSFFGSLTAEMNWDLKHHEMCRTLGVGLA